MTARVASAARAHLDGIMARAVQSHRPVRITDRRGSAVMVAARCARRGTGKAWLEPGCCGRRRVCGGRGMVGRPARPSSLRWPSMFRAVGDSGMTKRHLRALHGLRACG